MGGMILPQTTRFLTEIEEQPDALREVMEYYRHPGEKLLKRAAALCRCEDGGRLIIAGMGTSYYAATALYGLLANAAKMLPVALEAGELLHHCLSGIRPSDVLVLISQSGESYEAVRVAQKLKGHRVLAITNQPDSALAEAAVLVLPLRAGREETISCKSYTNTMAVLLLLVSEIAGAGQGARIENLLRCAEEMEAFLASRRNEIKDGAEFLREARFLYFISRGVAMTAAQQAALTWNEGVHMPTSALPGGSFRHGPYELARPGFHGVFFIPRGEAGALLEAMSTEVAQFGGRVLAFSGRETKPDDGLFVIQIEPGEEDVFPISVAVPQELLLARMAEDRGLIAGLFERGSKVTGRE